MQFHHHGYVSEDPRIKPAAGVGIDRSHELPDKVDVLIIGAGPAGMMMMAQMSQFPTVTTALIERNHGRLKLGHADGVAARSVETFQAFGFANTIIDEAYRITETAFWKPDPENPKHIIRTDRTEDDPTGISEFPHLIVNQARILDCFTKFAANAPARNFPSWGWEFKYLEVVEGDEYPVKAHIVGNMGEQDGVERVIEAKYALGADGAHSRVRDSIGAVHTGGVSNHAWGVMDVLADSDFPDIRLKSIIHSNQGSILHIPREGGYLFRTYVDLGEVPVDDNHEVRNTPLEEIIRRANEIVAPYHIDVKHVAWWSVYEVGHRVTDRFDDVPEDQLDTRLPHVFIAGDACHTHSAKAGQGMNVSMQDAFNLGWKVGHVLTGLAPASLLKTYTQERKAIAEDLIRFDRDWSSRMAEKPNAGEFKEAIEDYYVKTAEFPYGFATQYTPGLLTGEPTYQHLATGYPMGKRFKSAIVVRRCDSNPKHLGHLHEADGRWRIYVFADKAVAGDPTSGVAAWADFMENSPESPVNKFTPKGADKNALFDIKVIYQQDHRDIDINAVPKIFMPDCGPWKLTNKENVFGKPPVDFWRGPTLPHDDIWVERGLSEDGVVIVVRPDMYVANILPLDATQQLADFFNRIYIQQ